MGLFVIMIFVVVVLCGFSSGNAYTSNSGDDFNNANQRKYEKDNKNTEKILFEEESFFDDNGIEHIVDEDLYCAEHDDFYEEF